MEKLLLLLNVVDLLLEVRALVDHQSRGQLTQLGIVLIYFVLDLSFVLGQLALLRSQLVKLLLPRQDRLVENCNRNFPWMIEERVVDELGPDVAMEQKLSAQR